VSSDVFQYACVQYACVCVRVHICILCVHMCVSLSLSFSHPINHVTLSISDAVLPLKEISFGGGGFNNEGGRGGGGGGGGG